MPLPKPRDVLDPNMPSFNPDQTGGVIRAMIPAVVAWLAAHHVLFDSDTWNIVLTCAATAVVAVWSYFNNRVDPPAA
jgi:hypothetical protein